MLNMALLWVN